MDSVATRRMALLMGVLFFVLAFACRTNNVATAFRTGMAQIRPYDELYHAKRIIYSATHFPHVLEYDPNRGTAGAYCPWPPLYDLVAGGAARLTGGRSDVEILNRAVWIPPLVGSLLAGLLAFVVSRRLGRVGGLVAGTLSAFAPPLVDSSQIGCLDHHFLEPLLLLAILACVLLIDTARTGRDVLLRGSFLGTAIAAALLAQVALLLAAAVVIVVLVVIGGRSARAILSGAVGLLIASGVVLIYRATMPSGYPDDQWHLGHPHFAALLGAAVACTLFAWMLGRGLPRAPAAVIALVAGVLSIAAIPGAVDSFVAGSGFFRGDPWLRTIVEFQPLFFAEGGNAWNDFVDLGGAVLLLVPLAAMGIRSGSRSSISVAAFAGIYAAAALTSKRFVIPLSGLLPLVAAIVVSDLISRGRWRAAIAAAIIGLGPSLVGCVGLLRHPPPLYLPGTAAMMRAADHLRSLSAMNGRVLGPWEWGHLFNVRAGRPVIIDGFGTMVGRSLFQRAQGALFLRSEDAVAEYCRRSGVRFIVLDNPFLRLPTATACAEVPLENYLRPSGEPGKASTVTRLAQSTFWWRAYFDQGRARPERGRWGRPFRAFRLVYVDKQRSWGPPVYRGPLVEIWELVDATPHSEPPR